MTLNDKDTTLILENLQDKGDYFSRLCAIERKRINDLEDAIRHIVQELEKLRNDSKISATEVLSLHVITPAPIKKKCDGANVSKEAQQSTNKILNIFEAKLNRLLQKKSDVMNHVKRLKTEINHNRRLRVQTDIQHNKFENILGETKSNIERLLSESTLIVEERDKLLEKKSTLERINIDEQTSFQEEYEKMGNFIKIQNQALEEALLRERKRDFLEKKGQLDESMMLLKQGEMSLEDELDMARQVGTLTNFVLSEQNSLSGIEKKIHSYELIFEDLKKMTGSSSMEDVISTYVAQEEEMFSLYNFIQTVNSDIDIVLESTAKVEADIASYKEQQEIQNDQRMNIVHELEGKNAQYMDHITSTEDEIRVSHESISQISKKVSSLFFKLQCDQMDASKVSQVNNNSNNHVKGNNKHHNTSSGARNQTNIALIVSQGISESNVLEYMGCIEQRCVDIISEYIDHAPNQPDLRSIAGPSIPVHWNHSNAPILDLNDVNEDEYLSIDNNNMNIITPNAYGSVMMNSMMNDDGSELKPVDLSNYKKNLQKKLGLGSNVVNKDNKDRKDANIKPLKLSSKSPKNNKAKH